MCCNKRNTGRGRSQFNAALPLCIKSLDVRQYLGVYVKLVRVTCYQNQLC